MARLIRKLVQLITSQPIPMKIVDQEKRQGNGDEEYWRGFWGWDGALLWCSIWLKVSVIYF